MEFALLDKMGMFLLINSKLFGWHFDWVVDSLLRWIYISQIVSDDDILSRGWSVMIPSQIMDGRRWLQQVMHNLGHFIMSFPFLFLTYNATWLAWMKLCCIKCKITCCLYIWWLLIPCALMHSTSLLLLLFKENLFNHKKK